jgi:hypothetical protein
MKLFLYATLVILLSGCFKVDDFTRNELKWYKPYDKTDTVIFFSEKNESDTIIFQAKESGSSSTRGFEQGFYNTNYLTVPYYFTKGSYHQFAMMSDGKTRYDQDILNMSKSSSSTGFMEIIFIGTIFSDDNLDSIQKINDSTYFFDSHKATYSGMNVEKEIEDFTFNINLGITNYTDDRGVKWKRK